ncbi:hypothetical protein BJ138DRAFT_1137478 [Hygrophoropsis aurantiaca]|uniref:Uncharacterized protein n=1 Tax=Hygrophoropsis aurantiaca TaxID=72124 RepID=A0ACB8A3G5_9AGAM|nr:hypothetical protein BJ138DRAFT_1137478 [Hygrophoropsis aurantiaca]
MSFVQSPEVAPRVSAHHTGSAPRGSESPRQTSATIDSKERRKRPTKEKDPETSSEPPKRERKRRARRTKDEQGRADSNGLPTDSSFKVSQFPAKEGPETSSNGSGASSRPTPRPPSRVVSPSMDSHGVPTHSPTRLDLPIPIAIPFHQLAAGSRPHQALRRSRLSPAPDEMDSKRTRVDVRGRHTSIPSSRPSPIPFRTQPSSRSPKSRRLNLSPIATLSPASTAPSPSDKHMAIDSPINIQPQLAAQWAKRGPGLGLEVVTLLMAQCDWLTQKRRQLFWRVHL